MKRPQVNTRRQGNPTMGPILGMLMAQHQLSDTHWTICIRLVLHTTFSTAAALATYQNQQYVVDIVYFGTTGTCV